jgi:hypothetical protein
MSLREFLYKHIFKEPDPKEDEKNEGRKFSKDTRRE